MTSPVPRGRFGAPFARLNMVVAAATLSVAAALAATPARAATAVPGALGESGVSIEPARGVLPSPWLVYELDPGATVTDAVLVRNDSESDRSLNLYPADAKVTSLGGFEAALQSVKPAAAGAWMQLDTAHLSLAPHTWRQVGLRLVVPAGAEPGEYLGSVLAQFENPAAQPLRIVHRVGLRMYLTVKGGVVESGAIQSFDAGHWWERGWPTDPVIFKTVFKDTSSIHLRVAGEIKSGSSAVKLLDQGAYVVVAPGSQVQVLSVWRSHGWIGPVQAEVELAYSNHSTLLAHATTEIWIIPWKLVLLVLAVAVLAGYLTRAAVAWIRRLRLMVISREGVAMRMTVVDPTEHPDELPAPPPGRHWVVVAVQTSNGGSRPFEFQPQRFELRDRMDHRFHPEPALGLSLLAMSPGEGTVGPGGRGLCALAFALPKGAQPGVGIYRTRTGGLLAELVAWRKVA